MRRFSVIAGLMCVAAASQASISWFNTLGGWQGSSAPVTFSENFSGFATDAQFRTASVGINGGSLAQEGTDGGFRNEVDTTPFQFPTESNGTTHASMYTNFGETTVRMTFTSAVSSFAFESWLGNVLEGATLDVYNGATLLGSANLTAGAGSFLGFTLDGGDSATSVVWRSTTFSQGAGGEGFGVDNFMGSGFTPVPEPFTMSLLGAAAIAAYRKRRKALLS